MSKGRSKVVFDIPIDSSKRPVPESQVGPRRARLSALLCPLRRPISRVSFQLASSTAAKAKAGDGTQTVRASSHSLPAPPLSFSFYSLKLFAYILQKDQEEQAEKYFNNLELLLLFLIQKKNCWHTNQQ